MKKGRIIVAGLLSLMVVLAACAGKATPTPAPTPKKEAVPATYAGKKSPFPMTDSGAQAAGKTIYNSFCLSCHGEKGDGKGPAGAALKPPPADFTSAELHGAIEAEPDLILWRLSEGVPGTAMPGFKASLTEEQRWQVIAYIWSRGKK